MGKIRYNFWLVILIISLVVLVVLLFIYDEKVGLENGGFDGPENFKECVEEADIVLYGRLNSRVFMSQKEELGDLFDLIPFVDCSEEMTRCEGIILVPAWKLDDKILYGSFSRDVLIKLMGCNNGV